MYSTLIALHSVFRWAVLISLLYAIYRAYRGYRFNKIFSKSDNTTRHWTATIAHTQLLIGMVLYTQSPVVKSYWNSGSTTLPDDLTFFSLIHFILMLAAIVLATIGSALAKRKKGDKEKFKTMLIWFTLALLIILIAIPWPFSPFANRPYFRTL